VFRQGEVSDRLIWVLTGAVQLSAVDREGRTREIGVLEPGETAGETGLLVGDFHDVTAVAEGYARIAYFLRPEFEQLMAQRPYLQRRLNVSDDVATRRRMRQFDWIRDDEWTVAVVQRHWSRLLRQVAVPGLLLLLLLPAVVALATSSVTLLMALGGVLALPMIGVIGAITWQYINWRDDFFVVTTQRVVHIERRGPFSTQREESSLDNIEDIYELQPTLPANLLKYGNLVLQTAGETVDIDMTYVPDPSRLRNLIYEQMERTRARDVLRTRGQIRDLLARRLESGEAWEPQSRAESRESPDSKGSGFLPLLLLAAFWEYLFPPSRVETDGGDTVIWRRFWLPGLIRYSAALAPLLLATFGGGYLLYRQIGQSTLGAWLVGWLFLEAILTGVLLWLVEDWRNDYFQLTPTHIILVEQLPLLLQESRHEARLDRIQNLGFEIPNIFAKMWSYGHVQFETAGTLGKFELRYVRHPAEVQSTISNRQYQYRQRQREADANRRQQELLTWFASYDELSHEAET
jgi:hypothetical protein